MRKIREFRLRATVKLVARRSRRLFGPERRDNPVLESSGGLLSIEGARGDGDLNGEGRRLRAAGEQKRLGEDVIGRTSRSLCQTAKKQQVRRG